MPEWIIAVVDGLLMICILGGNCLTITVIVKKPRLATPSNQFVLGLALADMLVGFTMPYHMAFYISSEIGQSLALCLLRFVLIIMACCASVLHLIIIAVDRYLAIIYPLRHQIIVTKGRARQAILLNWLIALAISTIPIYWNEWHQSKPCAVENVIPAGFFLCVVLPAFSMLLVIMLVTYLRIHQVASSQAQRLSCTQLNIRVGSNRTQHLQKGKKSMQVVAMVLGCFCICWLPYLIIVTILVHGVRSQVLDLAYKLAFSFAMANSCMNPVIYAWKNQDFKCAFQELLACCRQKGISATPRRSVAAAASSIRVSSSLDLCTNNVSCISVIELVSSTVTTAPDADDAISAN